MLAGYLGMGNDSEREYEDQKFLACVPFHLVQEWHPVILMRSIAVCLREPCKEMRLLKPTLREMPSACVPLRDGS